MATGRDRHHAHRAALAALGKDLSRRARSRCELCGESAALEVVAVEGGPEEPEPLWALLLCARCQALEREEPASLRFLESAMWSELQPVQIEAVRALRAMEADWAREALDGLWLSEEVAALI